MPTLLSSEDSFTRAKAIYERIAGRLRTVLPSARIEHVGSSAVEGLVSKGDVDLFVGVDPRKFEEAFESLSGLGFHPKEGSLRTSELCNFVVTGYGAEVGIQLVANGSRFEFFIEFRDLLRRDPVLRERYNQVKVEAASSGVESYRAKKAAFIEEVLGF